MKCQVCHEAIGRVDGVWRHAHTGDVECWTGDGASATPRPIRPGDLVERVGHDLDPREVIGLGRDWLTLDILGSESPRLPLDNYAIVVPIEEG